MKETKTKEPVAAELPGLEKAQAERPSAVITRGINMPAHQVRAAIAQAVARGQVTEEEGEDVFWLYCYAQDFKLTERELAAKIGSDHVAILH